MRVIRGSFASHSRVICESYASYMRLEVGNDPQMTLKYLANILHMIQAWYILGQGRSKGPRVVKNFKSTNHLVRRKTVEVESKGCKIGRFPFRGGMISLFPISVSELDGLWIFFSKFVLYKNSEDHNSKVQHLEP